MSWAEACRSHSSVTSWFAYVSMPVSQFLLIRWVRDAVVHRWLPAVARRTLYGVGVLFVWRHHVFLHAATWRTVRCSPASSLFAKARLPDFKGEIAVMVVLMLLLALGPLLLFAAQLAAVKRTGLREYGTLAQRYVLEFDGKWLRGGAPADEPLVGSADIQSLTDLGTGYDVVGTMNSALITKDAVIQIVGATLAPIAPLVLTLIPLEQLVKTLARILF